MSVTDVPLIAARLTLSLRFLDLGFIFMGGVEFVT